MTNFLNWKMYSVICLHLTWMSKFELKMTQKKKRSLPVPLLQLQQPSHDAQLVTLLMLPIVERFVAIRKYKNVAIRWIKCFLGIDHQWWRNGRNQNRRKERSWWGTKDPNLKAQIEKGSRSCRRKTQKKRFVREVNRFEILSQKFSLGFWKYLKNFSRTRSCPERRRWCCWWWQLWRSFRNYRTCSRRARRRSFIRWRRWWRTILEEGPEKR